jgi:hypothetical protein
LFKLKMLPEMRSVLVHTLRVARYWAQARVMEICNPQGQFLAQRADDEMWARVILRSAVAEGGLESASAQAAWLDEVGQDDFSLEAWEAVQRRLSLTQGRVLGTTTPYNLGWLLTEVYDRWRNGDTMYHVISAPSTVNPQFPPDEFARMQQTLPDWKFRMMYCGDFARPAGLIYDCLTAAHWVAPRPLPAAWPRYVGIDFGAVHTALVWLAQEPETNRYFLYRESLEGHKTSAEHARAALAAGAGENVVWWAGGTTSETQARWDWQAAGLPVREPPTPDVEAGIDRVTALFKSHQLQIFDTCRGIRAELGAYSRVLDAAGQVTAKIKNKENFHRLDALRYAVLGILASKQKSTYIL